MQCMALSVVALSICGIQGMTQLALMAPLQQWGFFDLSTLCHVIESSLWMVQVQVAGQYPNNIANILSSTSVCNSIVHVVDQVRLRLWHRPSKW